MHSFRLSDYRDEQAMEAFLVKVSSILVYLLEDRVDFSIEGITKKEFLMVGLSFSHIEMVRGETVRG